MASPEMKLLDTGARTEEGLNDMLIGSGNPMALWKFAQPQVITSI